MQATVVLRRFTSAGATPAERSIETSMKGAGIKLRCNVMCSKRFEAMILHCGQAEEL